MKYPQLAGGLDVQVAPRIRQPFVGDRPISNDSAVVAGADMVQYQYVALMPDGTVVPFVMNTHVPAQGVITAIESTVGKRVPYYDAGQFNHAEITWPVGLAATLNARKQFVNGTAIKVGHLLPN